MNLWEFQEVHDHLERILGLIPTRHAGKSHLGVILPGTVARPDVEISGLPAANDAQRRDLVWFWDRAFWYGNLTYFAVALSAAVLALYLGSPGWASVAAVAAVALVILGQRFVVKLPHIHLSELRIPFAHGEVILLVDVPRSRVHEIEQAVSRHHPEAGLGGVGWTIVSAGI